MKLDVITFQEFDVAVAQCLLGLSPLEEQLVSLSYALLRATIQKNQLNRDLESIKLVKMPADMDEE